MTPLTLRLVTLALLSSPGAAAQTMPAQTMPATAPAAPVQTAPAQPTSPPAVSVAPATPLSAGFSLAQALSALTQAPGWRAAALQYLSASQNLDAARARAGLSLSAGAAVNALKVPIDGDWNASTTLNVQAAINVLPWSTSQLSVVQAARSLYRAGLDQRDAQNSLAVSVVQGYLTARQAAAALALAQDQQALAQRQLEVARAQQGAGVLTQENLLAAQASQEQAAATVAEAASTLDNALRQLYNTLGSVPAGLDGVSVPSFTSAPVLPAAPSPLETLLPRAVQGRSEVLKAVSNQGDAQAAVQAARLDRVLPDLSLSVQYGQLASTSSGVAGSTVGSALNFKTGVLSASASIPLNQNASVSTGNTGTGTTGGTSPTSLALGLSGSFAILNPVADVNILSAQTSLASAGLALLNARSSVDLDVRQKYAALQNALLALASPRTSLLRAQTALASAQARFQAGLATALDVQQAELNVVQAQNTLAQAVNGAYLASLNLSVSTGEFSPALLTFSDSTVPDAISPTSPATGGQP
ncbi:TolC family protein [Deinococcus radiomollis]|uniref:TolC family protein n=1 Tax=Deinococcus radiomollis TaxID=468916 RepID=UPI003892C9C9